ncbi:MAG: N-acetylmuramoyl-L-alanine amidase [Clostridiales bacterium]|nr:N-acetylmuramoyl-L-alanine amidase [Clostridiales bacterium]
MKKVENELALALISGAGILAVGAAAGVLAAAVTGYFIDYELVGKESKSPQSERQGFGELVITNKLLTPGASHGRTGQKLDAKGVVIHYVANPGSTAIANRNYFENGSEGNGTSCHYIVGLQGEILRLIPENERAMHAGKAYGVAWATQAKTNNSTYLGIEVCHPDKTGKFSAVTYKALVELVADICERNGFNPYQDIQRHYDVTGKLCPLYYVNNPSAWEKFKTDVYLTMNASKPDLEAEPSDWARTAWEWGIENSVTDGARPHGAATRQVCSISMTYQATRTANRATQSTNSEICR